MPSRRPHSSDKQDDSEEDYVLMPPPIISPPHKRSASHKQLPTISSAVHFSQPPFTPQTNSPITPLSPHSDDRTALLNPLKHHSPAALSPHSRSPSAHSPHHHRGHRAQPSPLTADSAPEIFAQSLAPVQGGSTALFDAWCVDGPEDDEHSCSDASADAETRGTSIWNQVEQYL